MSGKLRDWCVYYAHVNEHDVELELFPLQSVRRYGSWHGHNAMVAKHAPKTSAQDTLAYDAYYRRS